MKVDSCAQYFFPLVKPNNSLFLCLWEGGLLGKSEYLAQTLANY